MSDGEAPVVIIGGGPAGLAAAECLQRRSITCVVLEAGSKVAAALRRVDPEMRLLSPTRLSVLPGMQRRVHEPTYLPFQELVGELERYRDQHGLHVIADARVVSVEKRGLGFKVHYQTKDGTQHSLPATHVVNATGIISQPQLPEGFQPEACSFRWLHSLDARGGNLATARRLLVVGAGASAAEVLERWLEVRRDNDHAWLSVRSKLSVFPHWILGIDIHYLVWLPEQLPARWAGWRAGRLREPMTGLKVSRAIRKGTITRARGVERYAGDSVVLVDGTRLQPDLVVFATGFRYETKHLGDLLARDPDGRPVVRNCESTRARGLYLLGYRFGRTFASPYLRGIARDADYVARRIAQQRSNQE